ncbi:MAG: helix-hairpin-helix domain-containing protein [Deltaproteobacteria bacterium]|nr:helix-hairpin-helix domain-containing protein [Deltaproteobacteria bacterium]
MKTGREFIFLASILFILLINLSRSDYSLLFYSPDPHLRDEGDYVEIVKDGKARLVPLERAQKTFVLKNGLSLERGDSLRVSEEGMSKGRMRGGTLLILGLPINVNNASVQDLTAISGIGPKTAAAIVNYREKNGPFNTLPDLIKVKGIGKKRLAKMERFLTI